MQPPSPLRVESVNVGRPREVPGRAQVRTGIFKEPVAGRVAVRRLNLEGDAAGRPEGPWGASRRRSMSIQPTTMRSGATSFLRWSCPGACSGRTSRSGACGTIPCHIGDQLQVGSAHLVVTEPRMPCYKLGLKFGRDDILKRFLQSGYSGFYCAVLQEGEVAAGDPIRLLHRDEHR